MTNINDLLRTIGLDTSNMTKYIDADTDNVVYTITLKSSDDYDKTLSAITNNDLFEEDPEEFEISEDGVNSLYFTDDYNLELSADFNSDNYVVKVYEVK